MTPPPASIILDTTLRDGEQSPGVSLTPEEKADYVRLAESIGIRYLEVGFPHNSFDREGCHAAAAAATNSRLVAMALTTERSIDAAAEVGVHEVLLVVPSSDQHLNWLYGKSLDHLVRSLDSAVRHAAGIGLAVNVGLEDASQRDFQILQTILGCIANLGDLVDCVTVPDTRGQLLPDDVSELITWVRARLSGLPCRVAFHAHDDLGLATANSLRALQLTPPADCVHATVAGFGERAGNASLEQMAVLLETKLGRPSGIDLAGLTKLGDFTETAFLTLISAHAPAIGEKTALHESGLHQRALFHDIHAYSVIDPATVGLTTRLVLGKHSGKALQHEIAGRAEVSVEKVLALQQDILGVDKRARQQEFRDLTTRLRHQCFIGMQEDQAIEELRARIRRSGSSHVHRTR